MKIVFPPVYRIQATLNQNPLKQVWTPSFVLELDFASYALRGVKGYEATGQDGKRFLIITNSAKRVPADFDFVLRLYFPPGVVLKPEALLTRGQWLKHPLCPELPRPKQVDWDQHRPDDAYQSWMGAFSYQSRMRPPQIGAIHALQAHWTLEHSPATIVMPTGTGKTDTMLALMVATPCYRIMVVVPSEALRDQTAEKFMSLGILPLAQIQALQGAFLYPTVGVMKHTLHTAEEVEELFLKCNVVIATMPAVSGSSDLAQGKISELCTHLFIDEAHHIAAKTWSQFREKFQGKPIVQFTATPFRNDRRPVDGKICYAYPLLKAQDEGYFKPINFSAVFQLDETQADRDIAQAAIAQWEEDKGKGFEHLIMARVKEIDRVEAVETLYRTLRPDFEPVVLHSKLGVTLKKERLQKLRSGRSKVVICVDMLGEGFDLPELKIAALHDPHKSLGVMLQFTGRFTRSKPGIGEATIIANIADPKVNESLENLYAEDADWNSLLRSKSDGLLLEQQQMMSFINGFRMDFADGLSINNIFPKMSTVIFKMPASTWNPERFMDLLPPFTRYKHAIHPTENVLIYAVEEKTGVEWGRVKDIANVNWILYLVHWDSARKLLYIHSSNPKSFHIELAKAIGGDTVELLKGNEMFRCFAGIKRVKLFNVGLNKALNGPVRFMMYTGIDVKEGLSMAHKRNTFKSNLFGVGYAGGGKTSIGCSYKGKVWSRKVTTIRDWMTWCSAVSTKILDPSINVDDLMDGVLTPSVITERPKAVPIAIDWPESFYDLSEDRINITVDGKTCQMYDAELQMLSVDDHSPLTFQLVTPETCARFELNIFEPPQEGDDGYKYSNMDSKHVLIRIGSKVHSLEEFFFSDPPSIYFADGSMLNNNIYVKQSAQEQRPFNPGLIQGWDWSGVDLSKESQYKAGQKITDSIQYHVTAQLLAADNQIIFDDDGSGEAADIIVFGVKDETLFIDFYHCKYAEKGRVRAQVHDLYEVCGQAQKSVKWKGNIEELFPHMKKRENKRNALGHTRFEKGSIQMLAQLEKQARLLKTVLRMHIVQPAVSKGQVTDDMLELLGATELYLQETYNATLDVIVSP